MPKPPIITLAPSLTTASAAAADSNTLSIIAAS
jgi:hypothetical protein